jgi:hypothetical protein
VVAQPRLRYYGTHGTSESRQTLLQRKWEASDRLRLRLGLHAGGCAGLRRHCPGGDGRRGRRVRDGLVLHQDLALKHLGDLAGAKRLVFLQGVGERLKTAPVRRENLLRLTVGGLQQK